MRANLKELRNLENQVKEKKEVNDNKNDQLFKSKKYQNVESRFKSETDQKVLSRRNTYEGFKNSAMQQLNLNSTGRDQNSNPAKSISSNGYNNQREVNYQAPKIEYDASELESKSPEELDRILQQMEDYSKATYKIYGSQAQNHVSGTKSSSLINDEQRKPPRHSSRPPVSNSTQMRQQNHGGNQEERKHKNFGKVPSQQIDKLIINPLYSLQNYKAEKDEIQREMYINYSFDNIYSERELEKKNCPPGTRQLDEEERLRMLQELEASKNELVNQMERLPISMKTLSMQKRKDDLEEQIRSVDKNIALFSKKKVFVAI
ncbi:UNKNOWN [Stylonychia lemnae]|uniref:Enkurin domain-containing protein n=1 Tax=Stylonychia lemnae TaxID=5949 RepID=A0A078B9F4_STYLE|nr:UNKNOWN [Stylonychia lemnae]|eukprot:CDW91155.1 UNKNOWN [Stylonychia lemnae]